MDPLDLEYRQVLGGQDILWVLEAQVGRALLWIQAYRGTQEGHLHPLALEYLSHLVVLSVQGTLLGPGDPVSLGSPEIQCLL